LSTNGYVEVTRGGRVESRHHVSAAAVNERGDLVAWIGQPELLTFFRSTAKPLQAMPLVADGVADAFRFSDAELAVICASHSGEPRHVEVVNRILAKIDCTEEDLECGAHWPFHRPAADALRRTGQAPTRIHNNCSGKHAGMLAWAKHHAIETRGYIRADHPVQRRICAEIGEWVGSPCDALPVGVDGCGVPSFAQPLTNMAAAYARVVTEAERDSTGPAGRVTRAMTGAPWYVGGTDRLTTRLMRTSEGRLLTKFGAEAVYCVGDRENKLGIAVKVEDGHRRAVGPAVIEVLTQLDLLTAGERSALDDRHTMPVINTRGEAVGEIRPALRVTRVE
jgi:L-asparaginase II